MNNNGKSNIIFIFLIPIFFIVALIIMDTVFIYTNNKNLKGVTETIISDVMKNDEINLEDYSDEIKKAYERNGIDTDMLVVDANAYEVILENQHRYFGVFSSLSNKMGAESEVKILGITFKVKKNSVARIGVRARFNSNDELIFEYSE